MRERDIERALVRMAKERGGECIKWTSPGCVGIPDRILFLPNGIVIFIELKTETGKLSPQQKRRIARLRSLGATVEVVYGMSNLVSLFDKIDGF
ncbi:MAG: VRR-NUC domain-containing protein [Lentisphaerae bacterium]|nr:VRR-NUC domain-containing protein [Lentisphaerota bacterium]